MTSVELIYEYIHQRSLVTRSEFVARFDGPVLLFRRVVTAEELGSQTRTDPDSTAAKRVADRLGAKQLQLTREAYDYRLVRLPAHGTVHIGRSIDNEVPLPHRLVSKRHVTIATEKGQVFVTDLGSKNGTFIGERRLNPHEIEPLSIGQQVRVGGVNLRLLSGPELYDALAEMTQQTVPAPL